ncbi:6450_t:CDS:2 [Paraglomus occultum]|uniref:6450_t:CDS:1 n=1 Tax=Paraglomus occultum TaxID=144539 RepID=A0A9N9B5F8_9GLOM|nr:6450_t:CDS:2 [Paraglomus occultum]
MTIICEIIWLFANDPIRIIWLLHSILYFSQWDVNYLLPTILSSTSLRKNISPKPDSFTRHHSCLSASYTPSMAGSMEVRASAEERV